MTAIKNGTLLVKDSNGNSARVATLSQTDITTLNTALTDIEANKRKISSISANYVTTNTTQAITGTKVIKSSNGSPIFLQDTRFDRDTSPEQDIFNSIIFTDKNAKNAGFIQSVQRKDSNNAFYLAATRDKEGNTDIASLGVVFPRDTTKVGYATAPQTPTSASNNEIATAKFVNDKINPIKNNYVTTNTAQDISAPKTFVGDNGNTINLVSNNIDYDNPPSTSTDGKVIFFSDKKNKNLGAIYSGVYSDSNGISVVFSRLQAHNDKNTTVPNAYLEVQSTTRGTMAAYAPSNITHTNLAEIATTDWVNSKISTSGGSNPIGTIIPFAGSSIPAGYLLCNGATVSRTTYANLFKVIGTTYGAGDGSTTFKLPDARGRFPEGANGNLGAYHAAGLPNITGYIGVEVDTGSVGGAFYKNNSNVSICNGTSGVINIAQVTLSASRSSSIYNKSSTVQPLSFCVQYLIKY